MSMEEEATKILNKLGLTSSQAKVYISLLKLEKANAKTIAEISKVARQEVYRLLVELAEKGLVERIIAVPTRFRAVPIENGLSFLIEERRKELSELQKEVNRILPKIKSYLMKKDGKQETLQKKQTEFILIPESKALILRMERALETTEKSVDIIYPKEALLRVSFDLSDRLKQVLKRGVEIRCLLNEPLEMNAWPASIQNVVTNPLFKIRTTSVMPKESFWIYDEKEALLVTSSARNQKQLPVLWTTAEPLIAISENYFNELWKKAS
jgi:sugar-specific transcriptional regulator TrmB